MTLVDVAAELYGLPPAQFTAARTARVKALRAAGDRELAGLVQGLRKPTLAAWGVNLLVRHRPADVEELLELGDRLLRAQAAGTGDELRRLDRSRHTAMAALRAEAYRLADDAGQRLGDTADVPLESTLRAAMTDAAAAAAVRSGLLVQDLVSTGFGPVDVTGAVAVPGAPPLTGSDPGPPAPPATADHASEIVLPRRSARRAGGASAKPSHPAKPTTPTRRGEPARPATRDDRASREQADHERTMHAARKRRREEALADLDAARAAADEADRHGAVARAQADDLARRRAELDTEVAELAAALADVEARQRSAAVAERHARAAQDAASQAAAAAARRAGAARERLEALDD